MHSPEPDLAFYHAITLSERALGLRSGEAAAAPHDVDMELARRRLKRWRERPPLDDETIFAQRLAVDGLTEDDLLRLLGEPIEAVKERTPSPPRWMEELTLALHSPPPAITIPLPESVAKQPSAGFLALIEPLIAHSLSRLQQGIGALYDSSGEGAPYNPRTIAAALFAHVPVQLLSLLNRTMALELNVARLEGLLQGDTAEQRFQSFLARLRDPAVARALLEEYPVLARQVIERLHAWVDVSLEFLGRLTADADLLRRALGSGRDLGTLERVRGGLSERHRGGRSVLIASFSSGLRVVYKPRSLAVDVHFQELLGWVNERGVRAPFRALSVLDRGSYGWVEFAEVKPCSSKAEVERFYRRQGGYLALLYALEATDFHFENIVASGEHPILVDLESLLHPYVRVVNTRSADRLSHEMFYSVLRVGLLPQRAWANAESSGVDISGLGNPAGQKGPRRAIHIEGAGTDEMRFSRQHKTFGQGHNRPTLEGADVDVLDYSDALAEGFAEVYEILRANKGALLAEGGPVARFADDEVRVLLRPTLVYGAMREECSHPDVLRSALQRDRFLNKLWVGIDRFPFLSSINRAERESIERGDVPMFTARPSSRDVVSGPGDRVTDFFEETGLSLVKRRLEQLGDGDRDKQIWFIRASLATLAIDVDRPKMASYRQEPPKAPATRERLLAHARAIGDRLEALSLQSDSEISWIGLTVGRERQWCLEPLGLDLYGGLPGVALFLSYLGAVTGEDRYTALARGAAEAMSRRLYEEGEPIALVGGYLGWGGVLYMLAHLGVLWDRPDLLARAEDLGSDLHDRISGDNHYNVLGGSAGLILALAALYRVIRSDRLLAAASRCGERLLSGAQATGRGIGWVSPLDPAPLTGFSHGAAGIALSLLELAALTGEERFREAALSAIRHEREMFSAKDGNWPDLRGGKGGEAKFMVAWCHGAAGVGLGRLKGLRYLDGEEVRGEIAAALETTSARGFGANHSLCHGDLGNLDLLLEAGEALGDRRWTEETGRRAAMILESIEHYGRLSGVPYGIETPGLLTGLAGTGYELLRLAEPRRVPSVLVLEGPRRPR